MSTKRYVITTNCTDLKVLKDKLLEQKVQYSSVVDNSVDENDIQFVFTGTYTTDEVENIKKLSFVTNAREMILYKTC